MTFHTYQSLAELFLVHPKTVSRWVLALERRRKIVTFRPTRNTVRISADQLPALLAAKVQL